MFDTIVAVIGLILTFWPLKMLCSYLMHRSRGEALFDTKVKEYKEFLGTKGVLIIYAERILLALLFIFLGIFMSMNCSDKLFFELFVICLLMYLVVKYLIIQTERRK